MKRIALVLLLMVAGPLWAGTCSQESCVFYGGDFDINNPNANGLTNETDGIVPQLTARYPVGAAIYQNFVVSYDASVYGVFTNNLSQITPTAGYWEIRSGVSEGNGGTLIASGIGPVTNTPTGRDGFGYTEYHNEVDGLNLSLSPGTYWEAVVPVCTSCMGRAFNTNTFGLNSVGTQISDQQFLNSSFFGAKFTNADNEGVFPTFSSGVLGYGFVPEPHSLVLLGSGLMGAAVTVWRRFR